MCTEMVLMNRKRRRARWALSWNAGRKKEHSERAGGTRKARTEGLLQEVKTTDISALPRAGRGSCVKKAS